MSIKIEFIFAVLKNNAYFCESKNNCMNYEELLESRDTRAMRVAKLPIGVFYKRLINKKYSNVVKLYDDIVDNIVVSGDLDYECRKNMILNHPYQLHFSIIKKDRQSIGLLVEQGNFTNIADLLIENPSVVATPGFIKNVIDELLNITTYLHKEKIYHVCYAPETVLCRKGSNTIMLLNHGSFYNNKRNILFSDYSDFLAPEVLSDGLIDERTDIYSIGKFIESLFLTSDMPIEYRKVINRATEENPDARYQSVRDIKNDFRKKGLIYKIFSIFVVGLFLLGVGTFLWLDFNSNNSEIDYVKGAPKDSVDDLLDDGFNPQTELGIITSDSNAQVSPQQQQQMREYQRKAEAIFRAQFAKQANIVLNKIYNKSYMGANEKKFITASQNTTNELVKIQTELGQKAGLSDATSQHIASDIIESLTQEKMKALKSNQ